MTQFEQWDPSNISPNISILDPATVTNRGSRDQWVSEFSDFDRLCGCYFWNISHLHLQECAVAKAEFTRGSGYFEITEKERRKAQENKGEREKERGKKKV